MYRYLEVSKIVNVHVNILFPVWEHNPQETRYRPTMSTYAAHC